MLKYYRQRKGLTTRQLAESIGVVPATVLMYERERFPIPYQTAVAMAEVLEIDRNLLFDEFAQFMDYPYSDRLREVRKAHRLNQATFAEKAGISLSIYLNGRRFTTAVKKNVSAIGKYISRNKHMKIQRICDIAGTLYFLSAHWFHYPSFCKIKVH
mgnify:CR=1 FL=1